MTMGNRLEGFVKVEIVDKTNDVGLSFVEKTENGFWSTTQHVESAI